MKRVTVKDIARASGYSVGTVSKTLNGTDRVGAEAAEKIKQLAAEMGYRSSFSAQALVRKPRHVAIVLFRHPYEVRSLFEKGFEDAFGLYGEFGLEPEYFLFDHMSEIDWDAVESIASAVIVTPGQGWESCAERLDALGKQLPLVILQTRPPLMPASVLCEVTVHARVVGMMAAQYLGLCSQTGNAAILAGYASSWIHSENTAGFISCAETYGLTHVATLECFDDMDRAYDCAHSLLTEHPDLDSFFVTSYVSPAVCRCADDLNRDVYIIGVDLFAGSTSCLRSGSLSAAIFQNQQQQARLALEAVVNHMRGIAGDGSIFVKPELVLRTNLSCYGWK